MKRLLSLAMALAVLAAPVSAATILGTWKTEPDGKAQVGHVQIVPCGSGFCGTIVTAFDKSGKEIVTPNVGRQIIRDVQQRSATKYGGGTVYVPLMKAQFPVEMTVDGNKLVLRACNRVGVCRTQSWNRVK